MSERQHFTSGAPWESIIGYSRAVRVGPHVHVAGTTAVDSAGNVTHPGLAYEQTLEILHTIEEVLVQAGASMQHVVRTRIFVTNIDDWEEVGRAHGEFFRDIRPAATMVEVSRLIAPGLVVEIEADAYLG
ncbi:MAG: RidA family protein [Chloroflexota bacterium]